MQNSRKNSKNPFSASGNPGVSEAGSAPNAASQSPSDEPDNAAGRRFGLTSFHLKIIAILGMTANHAAYIFYFHLPPEALFVMFTVGGLTFPIMAFLLVEGYRHTSSFRKYAQRLLVFALISQLPFQLFLAREGNVMFTLLIGLFILKSYDTWGTMDPRFWLVTVLGVGVSDCCDWGLLGPIVVLLMYVVPDRRKRVLYPILLIMAVVGVPNLMTTLSTMNTVALPFALYAFLGSGADIPLLLAYNGKRGRPLKWFFYAYYPAHILVLGLMKGMMFGDWSIAF